MLQSHQKLTAVLFSDLLAECLIAKNPQNTKKKKKPKKTKQQNKKKTQKFIKTKKKKKLIKYN